MSDPSSVDDNYILIKNVDSCGNDICRKSELSIEKRLKLASTMDNCVAINTDGYLKHSTTDKFKQTIIFNYNKFKTIGIELECIRIHTYVKKSHYYKMFDIPMHDDFIFIYNKDSWGNDIFCKSDISIQESFILALSMDNCVSFSTTGYFKHNTVDSISKFNTHLTPFNCGTYIKKSYYYKKFGVIEEKLLPIPLSLPTSADNLVLSKEDIKRIKDKEEIIKVLETKVELLTQKVNFSEDFMKTKEHEIKTLENKVEILTQKLDKIIRSSDDKLDELNITIYGLTHKIDENKQTISNCVELIINLENKIKDYETDSEKLKKKIESEEKIISINVNTLLVSRLEDQSKYIAKLEKKLEQYVDIADKLSGLKK